MGLVLVTGGTGFIGSHIVRSLLGRGHQVAVLSRNPAAARTSVPAGVEIRGGDVGDPASLARAMSGVQTVISAVQFPNHPVENPRRGYTYAEVDGRGTGNQVQAAKAAGVRRFIYLSGAGTGAHQTAPWFVAKHKAEQAIVQSGIPYTIFRPSWVYGPEDRSLNKYATFARLLPFIPVIGDGRIPVQPLHVDDLAEAVATCVTLDRATNQVYEIGGPQELSMNEIIQTVLRAMGKRKPLLHSPVWLMKLVTAPLVLLPTPPMSPSAVDFVLMEEHVDNGPLLRDFGLVLTPLASGLRYMQSS